MSVCVSVASHTRSHVLTPSAPPPSLLSNNCYKPFLLFRPYREHVQDTEEGMPGGWGGGAGLLRRGGGGGNSQRGGRGGRTGGGGPAKTIKWQEEGACHPPEEHSAYEALVKDNPVLGKARVYARRLVNKHIDPDLYGHE